MESGFFVMYVASTDSNIAEGGTCSRFTIKLSRFLNFDPNTGGRWSVALSEITLPRKKAHSARDAGLLVVECPETGSSSIVNGGLASVLRCIAPPNVSTTFAKWIYVPLQHSSLNHLSIRLRFIQREGEPAINPADYFDQESPTYVTLVFKRA